MSDKLFAGLYRSTLENGQFLKWLSSPGLRIERSVSTGQASPESFWYDQPGGEWVLQPRQDPQSGGKQ